MNEEEEIFTLYSGEGNSEDRGRINAAEYRRKIREKVVKVFTEIAPTTRRIALKEWVDAFNLQLGGELDDPQLLEDLRIPGKSSLLVADPLYTLVGKINHGVKGTFNGTIGVVQRLGVKTVGDVREKFRLVVSKNELESGLADNRLYILREGFRPHTNVRRPLG